MVIYKKAQKVCGNGKVSIYYSLPFGWRKETDLIYEGIATIQIDHLFGGVDRIKKLT